MSITAQFRHQRQRAWTTYTITFSMTSSTPKSTSLALTHSFFAAQNIPIELKPTVIFTDPGQQARQGQEDPRRLIRGGTLAVLHSKDTVGELP